jgi:hypothetical protein
VIEIHVEQTGMADDRAFCAKAYLGSSKREGGVVFAYGINKDDARERLIAKLKSWAKENIK